MSHSPKAAISSCRLFGSQDYLLLFTEILTWVIIVIVVVGMIRDYFRIKLLECLTPTRMIYLVEGLWIAIVIASMILCVVFLLPATIDP